MRHSNKQNLRWIDGAESISSSRRRHLRLTSYHAYNGRTRVTMTPSDGRYERSVRIRYVFGLMYARVYVSLCIYIYIYLCVYVCVQRIEAPGCSRSVAPYDLRALTLARVSSCNIGHGSRMYTVCLSECASVWLCIYC